MNESTVASLARDYMRSDAAPVRPDHWLFAARVLSRFCRMVNPAKRLASLTWRDVATFERALTSNPNLKLEESAAELQAVFTMLRWGVDTGVLARFPAPPIKAER